MQLLALRFHAPSASAWRACSRRHLPHIAARSSSADHSHAPGVNRGSPREAQLQMPSREAHCAEDSLIMVDQVRLRVSLATAALSQTDSTDTPKPTSSRCDGIPVANRPEPVRTDVLGKGV